MDDREWVRRSIPEARTDEQIGAIAEGIRYTRALLEFPDAPIQTPAMEAAELNAASARLGAAWDALSKAQRTHPTFNADLRAAMKRRGVSLEQAGMLSEAIRDVIDMYRTPLPSPKSGKPRNWRLNVIVHAAQQLKAICDLTDNRAAERAASLARHLGVRASAPTIRQTLRNRAL